MLSGRRWISHRGNHPPEGDPVQGPAESASGKVSVGLAAVLIILAVGLVYFRSLPAPFVYDDKPSIVENPALHHISTWLHPPGGGTTVDSRPVLNASFGLNYILGGLDPRGYRSANILIHLGAGLALCGLLRRTFLLPRFSAEFRADSLLLATVIALAWCLHPLQTEAVTYIVQRAESLAGLLLFVCLYCFVRGSFAAERRPWYLCSVAACWLGMGVKETMFAAPLLVLLYDRAFISGSFASAWSGRRRYYITLAASWIVLAVLVYSSGGNRGGSRGFGLGIPWPRFLATQFPVILHYFRLIVWPHPLVFEYGPYWVKDFSHFILPFLTVGAALLYSAFALYRNRPLGFLGAAFWLVLAPTSLLPGASQMIVEHRLYIPLGPALTVLCIILYRAAGRAGLGLALAGALTLGVVAERRNRDYRSEIALWQDTVSKSPRNLVAHGGLGAALAEAGRLEEAIAEDQVSLALQPNYLAYNNLGSAYLALGRPQEALDPLRRSRELNPAYPDAEINLGVAADLLHQPAEALTHFASAYRLNPHSAQACNDLGDALSRAGNTAAGLAKLREALALRPDYTEAHFNLAAALARDGQLGPAQSEFERGLRQAPNPPEAYINWGSILAATNHLPEAVSQYEVALQRFPQQATLYYNYGSLLARQGKLAEAGAQFSRAVALRPDYEEAQNNLGNTLLLQGRETDAIVHYELALRLRPQNAVAHNNLGLALARLGRLPEAEKHFAAAVEQAPDYRDAENNLRQARLQLGMR